MSGDDTLKEVNRYAEKVKTVKVNTDQSPNVAGLFKVQAIPTVLLLKKGVVLETWTGLKPRADFEDLIEKHLAAAD